MTSMPISSTESRNLQARVEALESEVALLQAAVRRKEFLLHNLSSRISHCEHLAGIGVDFSHPYSLPSFVGRQRGDSGDTKDTENALIPPSLQYKPSDISSLGGSPSKRKRTQGTNIRKNQHKVCTFEGCEKMAHGPTYVYCLRHGGGYRCQEPGCTRSAYSTKFCSRHGGGPCQQAGCSKGAISNSSFCRKHGGGSRCQHPNCPEGARQGFSFCLAHGGFLVCAYPNCPGIALLTASYCRQHNALFKTTKSESA